LRLNEDRAIALIMTADVYRTEQRDTFLLLPKGQPFSSLPQDALTQLGTLQFWKTVELLSNTIAVNPDVVEADFQKQGFSVQGIKIQITEQN
jgi:uncharacterized protein YcgL (UPF0745 family)